MERILDQLQMLADTAESAHSSLKQRGHGNEDHVTRMAWSFLKIRAGCTRTNASSTSVRRRCSGTTSKYFITKFRATRSGRRRRSRPPSC